MRRTRSVVQPLEQAISAWNNSAVTQSTADWFDESAWSHQEGISSSHGTPWKDVYQIVHVGTQMFGIPLIAVQTVLAAPALTRVPGTHAALLGIVSVRGVIVPVLAGYAVLPVAAHVKARHGGVPNDVLIVHAHHDWLGLAVDGVGDRITHTDPQLKPDVPMVDLAPLFALNLKQ